MADVAHVTFRVEFHSVDVVVQASERLGSAGFTVVVPPEDASGLVLEASLSAEVDQADAALNRALTGLNHDPLIEWQAARLTGFV